MSKPQTIEELVALINSDPQNQNLIKSVQYIKSKSEGSSSLFDFSESETNEVILPDPDYKNHCFSKGFLYYSAAYQKLMQSRLVVLVNDSILFDMNKIKKTLRCSIIKELKYDTDLILLEKLQKFGYIRSSLPLTLKKQMKHAEVIHHLDDVFNPESYKNSKKRSQRLVQPFKVLEQNKVTLRKVTTDDIPAVDAFCNTWTSTKLEDPKVFAIMFSNPAAHIKLAIADETYGEVWGYFVGDELINLQLFYVEGEYAYSLYNVTTRNNIDARINAACYIDIMKHLKDRGVKYWNVGLALNKNLSAFKHHYPSQDVYYYHYATIKDQKVDNDNPSIDE